MCLRALGVAPKELFLAWVLALWSVAFRDGHFEAHGVLASIAHCELDMVVDFRNTLLCLSSGMDFGRGASADTDVSRGAPADAMSI